ncbi:hypothetical protein SAMN02745900_02941 [Pseudomonas sp. URIL14HWK12:I8]|nr:hypothetical protein SAMN02745900_02941 [Pseudomonas sp. URIL14HWK12:I8]
MGKFWPSARPTAFLWLIGSPSSLSAFTRLQLPDRCATGGCRRDKVETWRAQWDKTVAKHALVKADPINPQRVVHELSPRLPDHAIITSDSGSCANWFARDLQIRQDFSVELIRHGRAGDTV